MAKRKPATKATKKSTKRTTANGKTSKGLSAEERAAIKARAQELKAEANKADLEKTALSAIAAMPGQDRAIAKRIHELVKANAPVLTAKTWYGMPAYANKDGKVVCFFQSAHKFDSRYSSFGFNDQANLDDGNMWPIYFAIKKLTPAEEKKIAALVKKAVS